MNKIIIENPIPHKYSYNNILPTALSVPEIVLKRTLHLFMPSLPTSLRKYSSIKNVYNYFTPNKKLFEREVKIWSKAHKSSIIKAYNNNRSDQLIIKFPLNNILLMDAMQKGYIKIVNKNELISLDIHYNQNNLININFLNKELVYEIASTLSYIIPNLIFTSLNLSSSIYIKLPCAVLYGLSKGLSKFLCGNCTLSDTPWKTLVEVYAETVTELSLFISGKQLNSFVVNATKGFYRYWFDQYGSGNYDLMSIKTGSLDILKSGLKGLAKTYFGALLMNQFILGQAAGSILGAIISVCFINIFIDHAGQMSF